MADNKKETERAELHRTIWGIANDLRGSVDGWDFKQYVLGMLFYRYISENLDRYISKGEIDAGNTEFSYAKLSDEEALTAKDDITEEVLLRLAEGAGVKVFGMSDNHVEKSKRNLPGATVILGFAALTEEEIIQGIEQLKKVWL